MSSRLRARLSRVTVLGVAAGTVAAAASLGVPVPTASAAPTPCKSTEVTVIVVGQGTGCARAGLTGAGALEDAGFTLTRVQTQPGFICRINGAPANDPCVRTPPATAYWSYWHAPLGGDWTYSNWGADNRTAPAGTVEAWAFGDSARPGAVPDAPVAAAPTTARQSTPRSQVTSTRTAAPRTPAEAPQPAGGAGQPAAAPRAAAPATEGPVAAPDAPAPAPAGAPGSPSGPAEQSTPIGAGAQPDPGPPEAAAPAEGDPLAADVSAADAVVEEQVAAEDVLGSGDASGLVDGSDVVATGAAEPSQSPWPYVAVGALVLVLAGAGVYAARRYRG